MQHTVTLISSGALEWLANNRSQPGSPNEWEQERTGNSSSSSTAHSGIISGLATILPKHSEAIIELIDCGLLPSMAAVLRHPGCGPPPKNARLLHFPGGAIGQIVYLALAGKRFLPIGTL